jgi:hypothetical protein
LDSNQQSCRLEICVAYSFLSLVFLKGLVSNADEEMHSALAYTDCFLYIMH